MGNGNFCISVKDYTWEKNEDLQGPFDLENGLNALFPNGNEKTNNKNNSSYYNNSQSNNGHHYSKYILINSRKIPKPTKKILKVILTKKNPHMKLKT